MTTYSKHMNSPNISEDTPTLCQSKKGYATQCLEQRVEH